MVAIIAILKIWLFDSKLIRLTGIPRLFLIISPYVGLQCGRKKNSNGGSKDYNKWKKTMNTSVYVTMTMCFLCRCVYLCRWGMAVGIYTRSLSHDYHLYIPTTVILLELTRSIINIPYSTLTLSTNSSTYILLTITNVYILGPKIYIIILA
jgi:hypothetical protein